MSTLELKIPPPLVALLIGVAMWFLARSGPSLELPLFARAAAFIVITKMDASAEYNSVCFQLVVVFAGHPLLKFDSGA